MQVYLCYKPYNFKMSLSAMKSFREATGKDLWCTLLSFVHNWQSTADKTQIERFTSAFSCVSFEDALQAIHCMIKEVDKSVGLDEIEDGMFRCGWLPERDFNDKAAPYPLVLVSMALSINKSFEDNEKLKKSFAASRKK